MTKLATWRLGECVDPALCTVGATPSTGSCREHTERRSEAQRCREVHRKVQDRVAQRGARCREVESGAAVQRGAALPEVPNGAAVQ